MERGLIDLIELAGIKLRGYKFKIHCATYDKQLKERSDPLKEFDNGTFKDWQEFQTKRNFECSYILSLIRLKDEKWKWRFAGVYEVIGDAKLSTLENIPHWQYSTQEVKGIEHLTGKAIVHFERPGRACYLWGEKYGDKLFMVELRE